MQNGKVDYNALEQLINHVIEGGVDYLVSLGTTGEAVTLYTEECREVLDFTIKINAGRLPIVAGHFGSNRTDYLVGRIHQFNFEGVDAVLSSSPSYIKPTQEGIFQHYMKIADACPKPIILYNVPGRTASTMSPETVVRIAKANDKFIGVKDATGDLVQGAQVIKDAPENFLVLSGDDPTALPLIACGAHGVISVIANAYPGPFSDLIRKSINGDFATAKKIHLDLLNIHPWLYADGNPVGIKAALEILGIGTREVRLPLSPIQEQNLAGLKAAMESFHSTI